MLCLVSYAINLNISSLFMFNFFSILSQFNKLLKGEHSESIINNSKYSLCINLMSASKLPNNGIRLIMMPPSFSNPLKSLSLMVIIALIIPNIATTLE